MLNCTERIRLKQEFDLAVVGALASDETLARAGFPNHHFRNLSETVEDANRRGEAARTAYISHIQAHACCAESPWIRETNPLP